MELKLVGFVIKAQVRASMKDKVYRISLTVDGAGGIREAECECPRGKWLCSYMAAASIYANKHGLSKTDLPNAWIARPKKAAKYDTKALKIFSPTQGIPTMQQTVSQCDKDFLYNQMSEAGVQCPLSLICRPEPPLPEPEVSAPALTDDLQEYFIIDKEMFLEKCKVSPAQIKWVASNTILQCHSQM